MRILLVDDDNNKIHQIEQYVRQICPDVEFAVRRSFQSGLREILLNTPHVVLLDMTMPNYDVTEREPGGRERRYAGQEILRQMHRKGLSVPVIVVTQYEQFEEDGRLFPLTDLAARLQRDFPTCFLGAVFYQVANTDWMSQLSNLLDKLGGSRG